jgi:hypothetical protein
MAFTLANWACISSSLNQGQETVVPYGGSSTVLNAPNDFSYGSPNDTVAQIAAADYFLPVYKDLQVGDWIFCNGTDASEILIVVTVSATSVTTAGFAASGTVNTANIVDDAVTFAKLQDATIGGSLIGEPTNTPGAEFQEVTLGNGLDFSGTTLEVPATNLNYVAVPITAAQWNGMYAAPKLLIAAPGANKLIVVDRMVLAMTFVSAAYAAGGVVAAQWDATTHGAGQHATTTEAAADFAAAASSAFMFEGNSGNAATIDGGLVPFLANVNKGLYLSNQTGAFTTGDGTWVAHIWYKVIPTV